MKLLKRLIISLAAVALPLSIVVGQGAGPPSAPGPFYAPNWYQGYVPTPYQWQLMWSSKVDYYSSGIPVAYGGTGATSGSAALANLGGMSNALSSASIFIGNASNIAQARAMSGDCTLSNTGVISCGSVQTGTALAVVTGSGSVTAPVGKDVTVVLNKNTPAATAVVLPSSSNWPSCPSSSQQLCPVYRIKDGAGNAATYAITVTTNDGKTIDGQSNFIINSNYQGNSFILNGTQWNLF